MSKIAFLFPGQGSQHPGMGADLVGTHEEARAAFDEMDAALDSPISELCFTGTAEDLKRTENTQPAILAHGVAAWRVLAAAGLRPDFVAGHSLGEYTALVAAGVLKAADAVATVRRRGRYMQEAVPVGQGAMAALIGPDREQVEKLCAAAIEGDEVLTPANFNSAGQVVVAGHAAAVDRAVELARDYGARRAVKLDVSAPFHCPLMAPAAAQLAPDLDDLPFADFTVPLIANVSAQEVSDPQLAREGLKKQVTAPVLWEDTMARLAELGVTTFVELGPGKVLAGLAKRAVKGATILPGGTSEELATVVSTLS